MWVKDTFIIIVCLNYRYYLSIKLKKNTNNYLDIKRLINVWLLEVIITRLKYDIQNSEILFQFECYDPYIYFWLLFSTINILHNISPVILLFDWYCMPCCSLLAPRTRWHFRPTVQCAARGDSSVTACWVPVSLICQTSLNIYTHEHTHHRHTHTHEKNTILPRSHHTLYSVNRRWEQRAYVLVWVPFVLVVVSELCVYLPHVCDNDNTLSRRCVRKYPRTNAHTHTHSRTDTHPPTLFVIIIIIVLAPTVHTMRWLCMEYEHFSAHSNRIDTRRATAITRVRSQDVTVCVLWSTGWHSVRVGWNVRCPYLGILLLIESQVVRIDRWLILLWLVNDGIDNICCLHPSNGR